jgi:hypothetical protein
MRLVLLLLVVIIFFYHFFRRSVCFVSSLEPSPCWSSSQTGAKQTGNFLLLRNFCATSLIIVCSTLVEEMVAARSARARGVRSPPQRFGCLFFLRLLSSFHSLVSGADLASLIETSTKKRVRPLLSFLFVSSRSH